MTSKTTQLAPTPALPAGSAHATDPHRATKIFTTLLLATPRRALQAVCAELARNPKNGPRYAGGNERYAWNGTRISGRPRQHYELVFAYNYHRVQAGVERLLDEVADAEGDGFIIRHAREQETYASDYGRLADLKRSHDAPEYSQYVEATAEWLAGLLQQHAERPFLKRYCTQVTSLTEIHALSGTPKFQIQQLARGAILRWLPAVQNVISRLPADGRLAAAEAAQSRLSYHLLLLDKLYALCRKSVDEHQRWTEGFGALDMAIFDGLAMVDYLHDLSGLMNEDDLDQGGMIAALRDAVQDAWGIAKAAVDELASKRFQALRCDIFQRKRELVAFGHATGGISPPLEALYHARGSKFVAY